MGCPSLTLTSLSGIITLGGNIGSFSSRLFSGAACSRYLNASGLTNGVLSTFGTKVTLTVHLVLSLPAGFSAKTT